MRSIDPLPPCSCVFRALAALLLAVAGWTADPPSPVAKTGQSVPYAAQDDGTIQAGAVLPVPRFTDNRDGTVTDRATGLVWLQDPARMGFASWSQALAACAGLASGQAGLSDGSTAGQWRLPNRNELASLIDYGRTLPALPQGHPFAPAAVENRTFWSSTTVAGSGGINAFYVSSSDGQILFTLKSVGFGVWPVRDSGLTPAIPVARTGAADIAGYTEVAGEDALAQRGVVWPVPRFTDLGNGTVRDNLTQLIWLKNANPVTGRTWAQALAACATLASGQSGLSDGSQAGDWRLPNVNEMRSLFSAGVSGPAVPNTAGTGPWTAGQPFTGVQIGSYWTSTTDTGQVDEDQGIYPTAYVVTSFYGSVSGSAKLTTTNAIWPVRGGPVGAPPAAPPLILRPPVQQVAYVGDTVVFQVSALANHGTLSYRWLHNGVPVGPDAPRLALVGVTSAQAGSYAVVVGNAAGSATSAAVGLILADAPPDNGRRIALAKTGQTASFAAGDDGDREAGAAWPSPRFIDNGDGTITDRLTGLVWARDAVSLGERTWSEALDACSALADGVAGLSDGSIPGQWRLPTRYELSSLVDFGRNAAPMLPVNHPFRVVAEGDYWTSTLLPDRIWTPQHPAAFYVDLAFGITGGNTTAARYGVWAVRDAPAGSVPVSAIPRTGARDLANIDDDGRSDGITRRGVPWPKPRFTDLGDGTVRDNLTSLIWLKDAGAFPNRSLSEGLAACATLASGQHGLTDGSTPGMWRLPNVRELDSLLSMGWAPEASATGAAISDADGDGVWAAGDPFVGVRNDAYMTSTAYRSSNAGFVGVDIGSGFVGGYNTSVARLPVWPVRSGTAPANQPPAIGGTALTAGVIAPGGAVVLSATATDDGLPTVPGRLAYTWSVGLGNAGAVVFAPGNGSDAAATLSATVSAAGSYVFQLVVSDGGFTATATTRELLVTTASIPGTIAVTSPGTWSQAEGTAAGGTVAITVGRAGGATGTVTIPYATQSGSAVAGSDFIPATGTLTWADGDSAVKTIPVAIIGDAAFEPGEQFTVQLGEPTGGAVRGAIGTATVTILNDDAAPSSGVLSFNPVTVRVVEGDTGSTVAAMVVTRQGGSAGPVSVRYDTVDGTALAGSDYTAASGTVAWAAGEAAAKTILIPVQGDALGEPDEVFTLVLSQPTGGAVIGATTATVTVVDDDALLLAGFAGFTATALFRDEGDSGGATIALVIERRAGSQGAVSVRCTTGGGTATAGTDYVAIDTVLTWADGESGSRIVPLTVLGDAVLEPDETVTVILGTPTGGVAVRDPFAVVTIANDDVGGPSPVPGDLNGSGTVTFEDLSLFLSSYGKSSGDTGYLAGANLNTGGSSATVVDFDDLAAFLALYNP